jgi:hypothetical protein
MVKRNVNVIKKKKKPSNAVIDKKVLLFFRKYFFLSNVLFLDVILRNVFFATWFIASYCFIFTQQKSIYFNLDWYVGSFHNIDV